VRLGTVTLAEPPESVGLPNGVVPSKKLTLPVAALGETVAVKVTDAHGADGFWELVRNRLEGNAFTCWKTVLEQVWPPCPESLENL
jgi:hypothetical protein